MSEQAARALKVNDAAAIAVVREHGAEDDETTTECVGFAVAVAPGRWVAINTGAPDMLTGTFDTAAEAYAAIALREAAADE